MRNGSQSGRSVHTHDLQYIIRHPLAVNVTNRTFFLQTHLFVIFRNDMRLFLKLMHNVVIVWLVWCCRQHESENSVTHKFCNAYGRVVPISTAVSNTTSPCILPQCHVSVLYTPFMQRVRHVHPRRRIKILYGIICDVYITIIVSFVLFGGHVSTSHAWKDRVWWILI